MSERTFETVSRDDLEAMNDVHWYGALRDVLGTGTADLPETTPIALVLPYRRADEVYTAHVDSCEACATGSLWEGCPQGNILSAIAADAVAAQHDLAGQN